MSDRSSERRHAVSDDRSPRLGHALPSGGLPTRFSDQPRLHRDPDFLSATRARLWEPHVAPINKFVDRIAAERNGSVPYVDPDSGGVLARVLFVLESPGGPAALGSGMLSVDNDDVTAYNIWQVYRDSRLPRAYGLHWNAVPWYVGDGTKNATPKARDVEIGRGYLLELLDLAPDICVVIAMGRQAQRSVAGVLDELARRKLLVIDCPHPGPIPAGVTHAESLVRVREAFDEARAVARSQRRVRPRG